MNTGRPLEYDPAAALDAAMQAFWRRGYQGTSMRELLDATGLSKSSFYQAFGSKEGAFEQALVQYCDATAAALRARLDVAESGLSFIESVLMSAAAEARTAHDPRGCMIVNVATEFSARDAKVRKIIANATRRVASIFVAAVRRAQAEGTIPAGRDAAILGSYLLSNLSGLRTMVKAGNSHRAIGAIVAVIMASLR